MVDANRIVQENNSADLSALFKAIATARGDDPSTPPLAAPDDSVFSVSKEICAARRDVARIVEEIRASWFDLNSGDEAPDGSIYVGYFDKKHWYAAAQDLKDSKGDSISMSYYKAIEHSRYLNVHGHKDWMLPPRCTEEGTNIWYELFLKKEQGAFKRSFPLGIERCEWYWPGPTQQEQEKQAIHYQLSNGGRLAEREDDDLRYVRCVRAMSCLPRVKHE